MMAYNICWLTVWFCQVWHPIQHHMSYIETSKNSYPSCVISQTRVMDHLYQLMSIVLLTRFTFRLIVLRKLDCIPHFVQWHHVRTWACTATCSPAVLTSPDGELSALDQPEATIPGNQHCNIDVQIMLHIKVWKQFKRSSILAIIWIMFSSG